MEIFTSPEGTFTQGDIMRTVAECLDRDDGEGIRMINRITAEGQAINVYPHLCLESGFTPIGEAVWRHKVKCIHALLDHPEINGSLVGAQETMGRSYNALTLAMMKSVTRGEGEIDSLRTVRALLKHGKISLNSPTEQGLIYPIHMATTHMSTQYLRYYLSRPEAQVNIQNIVGEDCLDLAIRHFRPKHLKLLLRHPRLILNPEPTPLPPPVPNDPSDLQSANPSDIRLAAISCCIFQRRTRTLRALLAAGADPNVLIHYSKETSYTPYMCNYSMLKEDSHPFQVEQRMVAISILCHPFQVEQRMEIATILLEAGGRVNIPADMKRRVRDGCSKQYGLERTLSVADDLMTRELPARVLSLRTMSRNALTKQLRLKHGVYTIRPYIEAISSEPQLPITLRSHLCFNNHDLEDHESDSDSD